jgi:hypothetical protein
MNRCSDSDFSRYVILNLASIGFQTCRQELQITEHIGVDLMGDSHCLIVRSECYVLSSILFLQ